MKDKPQNRGYFGTTKSRFFFEYRCTSPCEGDLCSRCLTIKTNSWQERGLKKRDPYREYYGLVTEPIPEPFFDSEWYQSKVKEVGNPSESDMAKAKKAQDEAKKNTVEVSVEQETTKKPVQVPVEKKIKKKPGRKPVPPPVPPIPTPPPKPSPEPNPDPNPPPKPAGKRRTKTQPSVQVQAIEVSPSLQEIEVYTIVVRPFSHEGTSYFRDPTKNKVYSVGKDKRPSVYVGRWDPETETIDKEFPDSDAE